MAKQAPEHVIVNIEEFNQYVQSMYKKCMDDNEKSKLSASKDMFTLIIGTPNVEYKKLHDETLLLLIPDLNDIVTIYAPEETIYQIYMIRSPYAGKDIILCLFDNASNECLKEELPIFKFVKKSYDDALNQKI